MYIPLIVVPLGYSDVTTMKDDPAGGDVEVDMEMEVEVELKVESDVEVDADEVLAVELEEVMGKVEHALEDVLDDADEGVPLDEGEVTLEVAWLLDAFPEAAAVGSDAEWFVPSADEE